MNKRRQGFTLIELLVVIAIIALLISILLPALGRARKAGQMAVSLSNIRQINVGCVTYKDGNKDRMPLFVCQAARGFATTEKAATGGGWVTWSFGGKNNSSANYWQTGTNRFGDVEAADRPLNPYIYDGLVWEAPDPPARLAQDAEARKQEAKAFKDPSDKVSHQQRWPQPNVDGKSAYDDVGSSYQYNAKWWDQVEGKLSGFVADFEFGVRRMQMADSFSPSKYAWVSDEYSDIIVNQTSKTAQVKNGYDDLNKSILGFLDGHASYLTVYPGKEARSYSNDKYTFVFEDLRIPGT